MAGTARAGRSRGARQRGWGQPVRVDERSSAWLSADGCFRTSRGGVYAAGDARNGSTKQLGAAVGDGIAALIAIRQYLKEHHHLMVPEPELVEA